MKVKNTELKSGSLLEGAKEGKIKNHKKKNAKKFKEAVAKNDLNLAPKKQTSTLDFSKDNVDKTEKAQMKKEKKPKNIAEKTDMDSVIKEQSPISKHINGIANKTKKDKQKRGKKPKHAGDKTALNATPNQQSPINDSVNKNTKSKKNKKKLTKQLEQDVGEKAASSEETKNKLNNDTSNQEKPSKDISQSDLEKIALKKAKKLAKKMKKQQLQGEESNLNETALPSTNGLQSNEKKENKNVGEINKVLAKKKKNVEKRQLIKDQKLAEKTARNPEVEAATVFVGNLPVNTKRVQILRIFKDFAPVNHIRIRSAGGKVLHKHKQRKSAGSLNAYVGLKNKETAEKAVSLNGVEFKGVHLRVTLASKDSQSQEKEAKRTVFVGNLKYSANEESLREIFSSCGEIEYVRCIRDGDKGCKGVAYVCFKTADAVGLAMELNQTIVDERPINVERYNVKKLGAKEAREAQVEKLKTSKKGAKQRLDNKKQKEQSSGNKKQTHDKPDNDKKAKKSEFRGVKVESLKKKQTSKKKKSNNEMLKLAKKIAPKD